MAHNLDINAGQASFVSAREDAWHGLGTVVDDAMTGAEALQYAHLSGWNLRKSPLETTVAGKRLVIPNQHAVIRDNPIIKGQTDILGTVGNGYQIMQNEYLVELLDLLVDESGAAFETAGAIDNGKKVFVTMKMPGHIRIGGVDPVDNYLAAMTSHDGSSSTVMMVTPIRIVCQNTMNLAFQNATNQFKVRHTVGASRILLEEARRALDFTFGYLEGFQEEAEKLINTTLTQNRFEEIITQAFGAPEGSPTATVTRAENKLDQMSELFSDAFTQEGVRETAWAGLNALTEWYDHFSPVRAAGLAPEDEVRSRKALLDPSFKNQALQLMMAEV